MRMRIYLLSGCCGLSQRFYNSIRTWDSSSSSSLDASLWEVNWSCLIKQRKPRVALKMVFSHPWGFLQNAPICRTGENGLKERHERDWGEMSGERREPRIPTVRPGCWGVWQAGSQPVPQRPCFAETRLSPWRRRVTKIIV